MKKWIWVLVVIAVIAVLIFFFLPSKVNNSQQQIETVKVERGDLRLTVGAIGVVKPYVEVEVKSKAGGEIDSFIYEEGDSLNKGDVVVRLDPEIEQSKVNQAHADLLIAEARLEKAKITVKDTELKLKRHESLFKSKIISTQELDDARVASERAGSDVKIAEAELIRAGETLKEAEDRLRDTEIKAPLTGTILKKYVEEGQVISSTLSSASEGTLLFTMADLDRIYVEATVDETDIGSIKPGQSVTVTVDAYPEKTFSGTVVRIAPQGRVESTITIFDVTIEVADEDKTMLKPMMTANTEILTALKEDILLVPSETVREKDGETGVYRFSEKEHDWIPVTTGTSDGILTEIRGNLNEGDEIILSGLEEKQKKTDSSRNLRRSFRVFGRKR